MPTIGQIVERYGAPEFIRPLKVVGPEQDLYILDVFYPQKGLSFEIRPNQKDAGQIKENMPISIIEYFSPGNLTNYFIAKWSCDLGMDGAESTANKEINNEIRSWPCFGKIELIETH